MPFGSYQVIVRSLSKACRLTIVLRGKEVYRRDVSPHVAPQMTFHIREGEPMLRRQREQALAQQKAARDAWAQAQDAKVREYQRRLKLWNTYRINRADQQNLYYCSGLPASAAKPEKFVAEPMPDSVKYMPKDAFPPSGRLLLSVQQEDGAKLEVACACTNIGGDCKHAECNQEQPQLENWDTAHQAAKRAFESRGHDMPRVVYWYLGQPDDGKAKICLPTHAKEAGVSLAAGLSLNVLRAVLMEREAVNPSGASREEGGTETDLAGNDMKDEDQAGARDATKDEREDCPADATGPLAAMQHALRRPCFQVLRVPQPWEVHALFEQLGMQVVAGGTRTYKQLETDETSPNNGISVCPAKAKRKRLPPQAHGRGQARGEALLRQRQSINLTHYAEKVLLSPMNGCRVRMNFRRVDHTSVKQLAKDKYISSRKHARKHRVHGKSSPKQSKTSRQARERGGAGQGEAPLMLGGSVQPKSRATSMQGSFEGKSAQAMRGPPAMPVAPKRLIKGRKGIIIARNRKGASRSSHLSTSAAPAVLCSTEDDVCDHLVSPAQGSGSSTRGGHRGNHVRISSRKQRRQLERKHGSRVTTRQTRMASWSPH